MKDKGKERNGWKWKKILAIKEKIGKAGRKKRTTDRNNWDYVHPPSPLPIGNQPLVPLTSIS